MRALTFAIRLVEPVLATQPQSGEENSAISYSFIPGSMIRGALIGHYLNGKQVDADDPEFRSLFLGGDVAFLNAYLAHPGSGERMLPRPLSWFVPKGEVDNPSATIRNGAAGPVDFTDPPKPPRGEYCWGSVAPADEEPEDDYLPEPQTSEITVHLARPEMRIAVHNASTDRNRKQEGNSQVFRYEALAPGQTFIGVILSADDFPLTDKIRPLLGGDGNGPVGGSFTLGGSHTAGYGRVTFDSIEEIPDWQEYAADLAADPAGGPIITCLSDLILRPDEGDVKEALHGLVGCKPDHGFWRTRLVGGFNRKWGLPLAQEWAIEAGSVFVFPAKARARLEELAAQGAGHRRAEGFGRMALDWFRRPQLKQSETPPPDLIAPRPGALSPSSRKLAQGMANRRLRLLLDREVQGTTNRLAGDGDEFRGWPRAAQLSNARLAARRAWATGDLGHISRFFEDLSESSRTEWERASVAGTRLREWIEGMVEIPAGYQPFTALPVVAGVHADWSDDLRRRTVARLIEGVLRRAVRAKKAQAEGGDHD